MSGLRCGRESVFKAAQTTDKLCLVWGWRIEQGERCRTGAAEGMRQPRERGWSPPLRSKSSAEHPPGCMD